MSITQYHGLDLPEFSAERPLLSVSRGLKTVAKDYPEDKTFLRFCKTTGPKDQSLHHRLNKALAYFCRMHEYLDINIVEFRYGLYPGEPDQAGVPKSDMGTVTDYTQAVPKGYTLAAEVSIVDHQDPTNQAYDNKPKLYKFAQLIAEEPNRLIDILDEQMMHGTSRTNSAGTAADWHYADIEPILSEY